MDIRQEFCSQLCSEFSWAASNQIARNNAWLFDFWCWHSHGLEAHHSIRLMHSPGNQMHRIQPFHLSTRIWHIHWGHLKSFRNFCKFFHPLYMFELQKEGKKGKFVDYTISNLANTQVEHSNETVLIFGQTNNVFVWTTLTIDGCSSQCKKTSSNSPIFSHMLEYKTNTL